MEREKRYSPSTVRKNISPLKAEFGESQSLPKLSNEEAILPVRSAVKSGCGKCG